MCILLCCPFCCAHVVFSRSRTRERDGRRCLVRACVALKVTRCARRQQAFVVFRSVAWRVAQWCGRILSFWLSRHKLRERVRATSVVGRTRIVVVFTLLYVPLSLSLSCRTWRYVWRRDEEKFIFFCVVWMRTSNLLIFHLQPRCAVGRRM